MARTASITYRFPAKTIGKREIETELVRKAIHMLVAFVPAMAYYNKMGTVIILAIGTVCYGFSEYFRLAGSGIGIVSRITTIASRDRDKGKFVMGPVTLGIGSMLALMMYPHPAATLAIFALALGDSFSSIIGKLFGRVRIPFSGGKTFAGSLACFMVVFWISFRFTGSLRIALSIGLVATILEALPTGDIDNIIIPVGTGFAASLIFGYI